MSLDTMTYGAQATNEFNAGFERAQEEHLSELTRLRDELLKSRDELVKTRDALARLQANEAFTMTRNIYPLLEAVGGMLAPIIEKKIQGFIELEINRQLKDQTDVDRELVEGWIRDELENSETYYTADEIDRKLEEIKDDIQEGIDVDEAVENYLSDNLADQVRDTVRDLSFTVEVR